MRTRRALFVLALFSLGGAVWLLAQSSLLDLEEVEVKGVRHTSARDVREAAALERGEPLLLVNRGGVAKRVERLPWVADAAVSFSFPGTLVIAVEERVPVAWVRRGATEEQGLAIVDGEGQVLDQQATPPEQLPQLDVEVNVPEPGRRIEGGRDALRIVATAPAALQPRVRAVRSGPEAWVVEVDGAEIVYFGAATDLSRKWAALQVVLERLGERRVFSIDVRAPAVPAVREVAIAPEEPAHPEQP